MRRITVFGLALALVACSRVLRWTATGPGPTTVAAAWTSTLEAANDLAGRGSYTAADSTLTSFAAAFPGTQNAREVAFWRALYRLDPRNRNARRADALASLDSYVRSDSVGWYKTEAQILRLLARGEGWTDAPPVTARDTVAARDETVQQLRAQVARLTDELDRIKRRLAAPQR